MKHRTRSRLGVIVLSLVVAFSMTFGSAAFAADNQITLTPSQDGNYVAELVDTLGGGDGLYKAGLNGHDMYNNLGYVAMGWRTTGGIWQNQVIGGYVMDELAKAGYTVPDADVEAPYGTKPASDMSSATDDDYAWEIQYQGTEDKDLGNTWDPEYASLNVQLVKADGTPVNDADADALAKTIGGDWWGYNPTTEIYQKNFAELFGMDYENDIAALPTTSEKVLAMRDVLMSHDMDFDDLDTVDDYTFIKRESIDKPNKEAEMNKRTKMAWNSCFTDPSGTDPADAVGTDGEFVYVGNVNTRNWTNTEGIDGADLAGKIILTDASMRNGFSYAQHFNAIGVASKTAMEGYLCPRDEEGNIMDPWYDSSRYSSGGRLADTKKLTEEGTPIVEWQFSNKQYDNLKALLAKADEINAAAATDADKVKVTAHQVAIGQIYPMTKTEGQPGVGQAVAIAEVKGSVHPEKRVMICAHVQEPGCNDNATGVASLLGVATAYKKLVDEGKIDRPKCTITFMWGDEMNMASYWMDGHVEETENLIGALDMDMTGEDPEKTGGVMRIEKTPDPSAIYGYTLDAVPWDEPDEDIPSANNPYYDENYNSSWGEGFVRLPDSHTLWGAGDPEGLFDRGWYLNDLYMYVTSTVIDRHDADFEVDVCPFEGGSDHEVFLAEQIPSVLTWHFTDYTYHTSVDTLYMSSPRELESVGITTLACGLAMSDLCDDSAKAIEIVDAVKEAAVKRFQAEQINTEHHLKYMKAGYQSKDEALANEKEVLKAWGTWYDEALESVATLVDEPSEELNTAIKGARDYIKAYTASSVRYAEYVLDQLNDESFVTAMTTINDYLDSVDVPEELQPQIDAIVKEAQKNIFYAETGTDAATSATRAIQEIETVLAVDASKKAQELANAKIDAQDEVMAYMEANRKYVPSDLGLSIVLDSVVAIGTAKDKDAVAAALDAAKAAIDKVVKAKKAKVTGLNVTSKKLKATVKWKKTAGVTGYQVVYKLKSAKKFKTLKTTKKLTVTSPKLKKGKTYQFKVRAYTTIQGKKVYGPYCKVKTVKIKK